MSTEPSSLMQAMVAEAGTVMGAEIATEQLDLLRDPDTGKLPDDVFRRVRAEAARGPGRPAGSKNKKTDQLGKLIVQQYGDPVLGMAAIYAMPLDQLVELLLVADGSKGREDRLMLLAERTEDLVATLMAAGGMTKDQTEKLAALVDRVGDLAKVLKTKPGELALKALNTQLAARREVAQYVHGKMPIAVDLNTRADVILNIPGLTDPVALAEYVDRPELSEEDLNRLEYTPFSDAPIGGDDDED